MLKVENLFVNYGKQPVLKGISYDFSDRKIYSIIGPNGSGKTTLFKTILGYLQQESGSIYIESKSIKKWSEKLRAQKIALIPQDINMQFDHTVFNFVMMGRYPYLNYFQNYTSDDKNKVTKILEELNLIVLADKFISHLSGGEQQRCVIARALVQETETILMDEAFSHLDINHQLDIMNLLVDINREFKRQIVFISHNINLASEFSDEIVLLKDGKIVLSGSPKEVIQTKILNKIFETEIQIVINPVSQQPNLIFSRRDRN